MARPAEPAPVGAVVVDFDGTACSVDVSEVLLEGFGDPSWITYNEMVADGSMGLREAGGHQAALLTGRRAEMLAFAVAHSPLDPTFLSFVEWAESLELDLTVVSDGFGFYLRPILEAAGLGRLRVLTNEMVFAPRRILQHPNGHPECIGCGTCKMLATQRARNLHGTVAFVGEGRSDRYGAFYADVVFAKDVLAEICERDGVPFITWKDFDDVRRSLETLDELPGPVAPVRCPGWMTSEICPPS